MDQEGNEAPGPDRKPRTWRKQPPKVTSRTNTAYVYNWDSPNGVKDYLERPRHPTNDRAPYMEHLPKFTASQQAHEIVNYNALSKLEKDMLEVMLVRRPGSHVPVTPTITIPNAVELLNKIPIQKMASEALDSLLLKKNDLRKIQEQLTAQLKLQMAAAQRRQEAEQAREQELRRLHSEALHHMGAYYRAAVSSRINPIDQMFALLELSMNEARHQEK
ncbi:unnamed protein product, partial [Mesorhabditis spiculigera]